MKVKQRSQKDKLKTKIRSRISGTSDVPRISVFRSNRYVLIQAIDDQKGVTIASVNDRKGVEAKGKTGKAQLAGKMVAEELIKKGVKRAVFDRNGFKYHGRVKAVAEGARSAGLQI
ncbi:50S ribosomal protein L18 [candidate division WWE3 bacterium CG08_land_8_20_14_0_20_40_13]|uniref:Large ribosomal subunit protein uL18 n=1 Tax=candidate division WWE3 bacterium CG08_land_8_20_14_0_20_40_13 TaxID=1975084 RepID=A0A2H0XEX5_UNCKA|nr:MAG: 50S ribosomal protein L18 [candidate division WWE3 bacterium CG08_land_8_20_14_0_20_40_13]